MCFAMNSHDWAIDAAVSSGKAGNQKAAPPMPLTKGLVYIIYNLFYWQQTQGGALNLGRAGYLTWFITLREHKHTPLN